GGEAARSPDDPPPPSENPVLASLTCGPARRVLTSNPHFPMRAFYESANNRPRGATVRRSPPPGGAPPLPGVAVDRADWMTRSFLAFARLLARYHRHQVLHLGRLGALLHQRRRVVLVGNHALDIADPLLFLTAVLDRYGRVPRFIGHENGWVHLPVVRAISPRYGLIPSRPPEQGAAPGGGRPPPATASSPRASPSRQPPRSPAMASSCSIPEPTPKP